MRLALAAPFTLAVLAFALPARPQAVVDVEALRLAYYDYDPTASLNPDLQPMPEPSASQSELRTRFHLAFDSAHDQRVTAIFTVPRKFAPPYPAVVLLAGSGGHKDTDYIRIHLADKARPIRFTAAPANGYGEPLWEIELAERQKGQPMGELLFGRC